MSEKNVQVIEKARLDDVLPGDHITWECSREWRGADTYERREGIAARQTTFGDWRAERGAYLTCGEGARTTLTIRRPITKEN